MTIAPRLPEWFRKSGGKLRATRHLSQLLEAEVPNSICQEARCPNRSECFAKGVLTFMILGTVCTRNCGFCSVVHGKPLAPDPKEADTIINAIQKLNLKFVVLTSPNRDDLPDNGSGHFANIVSRIKSELPAIKVEVLIPDFKGSMKDLETVVASRPDVINHNMETVAPLYRRVRKGSLYQRSLGVLKALKGMDSTILTKTGFMVGLGETHEQLHVAFADAAEVGVDIMTLGQYLKPDKTSLNVERYYTPEEFDILRDAALSKGIRYVFSGPLVRSSFLAEHVFEDLISSI